MAADSRSMAESTSRSPTHFLNLQISPEPPLLHSLLSLQHKLLAKLPGPPPSSPQPQPPSSPQPQPPSSPQPESPSSPSSSPQAPSPVSPENLHLTICGLGLADDGQESQVLQLLQDLQLPGRHAGKGPAHPQPQPQPYPQPRHTLHLQGLQVFRPLPGPPAASPRGPCAVVLTVNQARSASVMSVIRHLREALSAFLREPVRDAGMPYTPHVTLLSQCYHDDPDSLLDQQDRAADLGDCVVTNIYLSKLGDTTDQGVYRHRATFRLDQFPLVACPLVSAEHIK